MLRLIDNRETGRRKWILCGQLAGPWVAELEGQWREAPDLPALVDLSDVTFIDEAGERLLREMRRRGVEFVASGVETRDVLDNLGSGGARISRKVRGS